MQIKGQVAPRFLNGEGAGCNLTDNFPYFKLIYIRFAHRHWFVVIIITVVTLFLRPNVVYKKKKRLKFQTVVNNGSCFKSGFVLCCGDH